MSEESASTSESASAEEGLEAAVAEESQEQQEGKSSDSSNYSSKSAYVKESGDSEYETSGENSESKDSNKKGKSGSKTITKYSKTHSRSLEKRIGETEAEVKNLVRRLVANGMSEKEAQSVVSQLYSGQEREGEFPLNIDINSWFNLINQYMKDGKISIGRLVQSAYELFMGLTDLPDKDRNPYKDILKGAKDIFITGYWGVPHDISFLEENSGKKMVYLNTIDPDVIDHYARLIMHVHGKLPNVIAFSDGAKVAKLYGDKCGFSHINHVYAVGALPIEYSPGKDGIAKYTHSKVTYVCESTPIITALEKNYSGIFNVPRVNFTGDHLSPFYEKKAAKEIGSLLDSAPQRNNHNRMALSTSAEIESVFRPLQLAKSSSYDFRLN